MSRRCYSVEPINSPRVVLGDAEAHHLLHVLRAAPGMQVVLFDGSGAEFDAEVAECGRTTVELAVVARRDVSRELAFPLVLGVPLPKGDRQRWIVEKAVELGVTQLVPLLTEHSGEFGERPGDKLARYVIEASKQCGRNRLMEITAPRAWDEWLGADAGKADGRWIADPTGRPLVTAELQRTAPTYAAVGPEGGLTDAELAAARDAGWQIVSLGPRILRIETAAVALAALIASGTEH